jgi:transcriptional regulator with XRE-family HTH domain
MPRRIGNPHARRRHFIKEWREFRGLTQDELAEQMDATKAAISRVETRKAGYTQDFLELCSAALEVEPAILISRPPTEADRRPSDIGTRPRSKRDRDEGAVLRALKASPPASPPDSSDDIVNKAAQQLIDIIAKALSKAKKR